MPDWLQVWAKHQPVSVTITAARDLVLGLPATHDVLVALAWMAGILALFIPLSVSRYRRAV
jgi:ABC-2 type transport system permease protein/oleandomycin transport system permease protein